MDKVSKIKLLDNSYREVADTYAREQIENLYAYVANLQSVIGWNDNLAWQDNMIWTN